MNMLDYWWESQELPPPGDYRGLLAEVSRRRPPAADLPLVGITGNYKRFMGSALHKVTVQTRLFQAKNLETLSDDQIGAPSTVLMRWSPFEEDVIPDHHRARIPADARILNDGGFDSSKTSVQTTFAVAAGYSSRLDPVRDHGLAVMKSDLNGLHDGRIMKLPLLNPEPGKVFERLVNNTIGDRFVFDIRVPFVLGNPILAYVKFRERSRRFLNSQLRVELVSPREVLTDEEIAACRTFCRLIKLDYGELDILRDGPGGRIYVVDANNTPAGPPKGLSAVARMSALRTIAVEFRRHVFGLPC